MKFWKYIELDDGIGHGLTKENFPFWEMQIQGWNDNETFRDLTDLVTITAIRPYADSEVDIIVDYTFPELEHDLMIGKLVNQATSDLQAVATGFDYTI